MSNLINSEKGSETPEKFSGSLTNPQDQSTRADRPRLFVMNRHLNTAAIFDASCFEELQAMFRVGIMLPDGTQVNGIGRCRSHADFLTKAARNGTRVQSYE